MLNAQWWKKRTLSKKTSSKNLLGYVVSKCDKFADCFFDKKNRYFSVQFRKNMKKNKQHLCQNNVLSSNFSSGHVESSFVKLNERFSEKKQTNFCWMSVNDGEKIFDKHFSPETGLIDKQKTVLTSGLTKFRRNVIQKLLNAQWWKKKNFIKKNFFKKSSWIRGKQMWQICRLFFWQKKPLFLRSISEEHEKKQTTSLSKQCFVLKFFLWTRGKQFC